jgi:branched-subunit amino acid transport protein AzlD
MSVSTGAALGLTFAMGGIIFFCRLFPFLFFREKPDACDRKNSPPGESRARDAGKKFSRTKKSFSRREAFLNFVEKLVPPAAMTVLAFNAMAGSFTTNFRDGIPTLIAAALTALIHLWKRNPLFSIFGGVAAYIILA